MSDLILWSFFALVIVVPACCAVAVAYRIDRRFEIELQARLNRRAAR